MAAMESAPPFDPIKVREPKSYLKADGQLGTGRKNELVRRVKFRYQLLLTRLKTGDQVHLQLESVKLDLDLRIYTRESHYVQQLKNWTDFDQTTTKNWSDSGTKRCTNLWSTLATGQSI